MSVVSTPFLTSSAPAVTSRRGPEKSLARAGVAERARAAIKAVAIVFILYSPLLTK
jgi:hypothetical protein